ncbi:MAG TPA: PDZ domain-containing protein, partial [Pedobacter sp.]|uniref:PDZ domain-containing protein n=1 Tax=Pedobacter sp. TaxID=1411316 RepID=UPI002BE192E7
LDMVNSLVESPQTESLFELRGTVSAPVTNIHLSGFQLTQTLRTFMKNKEPLLRSDWTIYRGGAVTLEGAAGCTIKNCYFNSVGGNAIVFTNYNRNNEVSACRIDRAGSSAVIFAGDPGAVRSPLFRYEEFNDLAAIDKTPGPKTDNYPSDCLVYNNLIEYIGQTEKQVAGVEISMAMNIVVRHNTIDNVPRAGINISEGTWGGHVIEGNDVFNTVLETGDHGAFNSWGRDRFWHPDRPKMDSIVAVHPELILLDMIRPNVIRNNRFRCDHGWDIDLDDGSGNYQIYNNVLLNGGLKLREGFYRKVFNNVILNNSFHPHVWFKNSKDSFRSNIVSSAYFPIGISDWGNGIDSNFFNDARSLQKAQANGTDANSRYGDPMFIDAATGDYRVSSRSAALQTGFRNFPMDRFGVLLPRLRAIAQKVTLPVLSGSEGPKADQIYDFLGAKVKNLNTLGERSATGMDTERGVLLLTVPRTSLLYGKLSPNDVILEFNGREVNNYSDLQQEKMNLQLSHQISLSFFRNQQLQKIQIALK